MQAKKQPQAVDIAVGQRIKLGRTLAGMSQGDLAAQIGGVAFQQVQKYEKAINRVSASRMVKIAAAIGKPVTWLFGDDAARVVVGADTVTRMLAMPHGLAIARAVLAIEDNEDRILVQHFAERLAAASEPARKRRAA